MMYRTAVIGVLTAVAFIIATDLLRRFLSHGFHRPLQDAEPRNLLIRLAVIAINLAGLASLVAVALTGLIPALTKQPSLNGYLLIAHVTTAGCFAVSSVAVAVLWLSRNRLTQTDNVSIRASGKALGAEASGGALLRRGSFWLAVASAVPTLATALLMMFPVASPAQQQELLQVHRVCALSLVAGSLLFAYCAIAERWNRVGV